MKTKKKIFVIDDEADIQEIIRINLENEGYEVSTFSSAEEAEKYLEKIFPDLIILDVMMDGIDGYDFCKLLKSSNDYRNIPVIFLSAKTDELDKVVGLELGGDDYMTKPFGIKELKSRVKAHLRRTAKSAGNEKNEITYKEVSLNPENYSLKIDGDYVALTKTEFEILYMFMKHPSKIFSRDNIIDSIKGEDVFVVDRTIDVHIMNLRKKLGKYKNLIKTFSGVGYGFRE